MAGRSNPRRGAPRRRRSAEVARREILDAAQQRLSQGGPDAIRLQDIARDVGISHPTILHHFGSRDGLIAALDARAIHALTDDVAAILKGQGREPADAAADPSLRLVERLAETMDQHGLARLIAWWAMRAPGDGEVPADVDPAALVHDVSKQIFERIADARDERGAPGPDAPGAPDARLRERITFGVRLGVVAMFGDALIGDAMSQVPGDARDGERHRFRAWLADLLLQDLAGDPPG